MNNFLWNIYGRLLPMEISCFHFFLNLLESIPQKPISWSYSRIFAFMDKEIKKIIAISIVLILVSIVFTVSVIFYLFPFFWYP